MIIAFGIFKEISDPPILSIGLHVLQFRSPKAWEERVTIFRRCADNRFSTTPDQTLEKGAHP
jgi:hypothetical protein